MEPRAGEGPGDPGLAQCGTKDLETPDEVADKVGEAVDGFGELHQGAWALFIGAPGPGGDGRGCDEHRLSDLHLRPSASGPQFQDGHAFGGRIVWPLVGRDEGHAGVLDANLFAEKGDLLPGPLEFCRQAEARVETACGPTADLGQGVASETA